MSRITSATAPATSQRSRSSDVNRRDILSRRGLFKGAAAGALTVWAPRLLRAQQAVTKLTDTLAVIDGGGSNITAFSSADGLVLVDSGAPGSGDNVMAALKNFAP